MDKDQNIDESRRSLLKKAYVAPAVIALGTLSLPIKGEASSSLSGSDGGILGKILG